ncbi:MAG TPA: shikimate dehydrogenase [Chitinispirillaceae bacterium]|jgi:shikimate dehydrogenase|nr:shikimate dehydrogenase [Chitinispirillaceae bacterium]
MIDLQIKGNTRIVCLMGYPVAHSISPQIHNHAFRVLKLPYVYVPLPVPPGALHTAAYAFRAFSFAGANVTIPHKGGMARYCDSLSGLSQATGTVNTLYMKDGALCGTTTDPEGFFRALHFMDAGTEGRNAVILGNGGTARTLSIAISLEGKAASLTIAGRNREKVSLLAEEISSISGFPVQSICFSDDAMHDLLRKCDLLVNCTSVGMYPRTDETPLPAHFFHRNMIVFDSIYNPLKTRFLKEAEETGCRVQNGLRMLLYQALASFRLWTGVDVSEEIFDINELMGLVAG